MSLETAPTPNEENTPPVEPTPEKSERPNLLEWAQEQIHALRERLTSAKSEKEVRDGVLAKIIEGPEAVSSSIEVAPKTEVIPTPETIDSVQESAAHEETKQVNSEQLIAAKMAAMSAEPVTEIAQKQLQEFETSRTMFNSVKETIVGKDEVVTSPVLVQKTKKVLTNFTRFARDSFQKVSEKVSDEDLEAADVTVEVIGRNDIVENSDLLSVPENRNVLKSLLELEVYKEVGCSHLIEVRGVTPAQFRYMISRSGDNPTAFLSDDRRENGGRIAIDNKISEATHPYIGPEDPDYESEMKLWQQVFPEAPKVFGVDKWSMSRNHGVIYALKDKEGEDVLLIPIHVDPKNAVAFFGELVHGKKDDQKSALEYHALSEGNKQYLGTGLYDLGCKYFIDTLRSVKESGLINSLTVKGEENLITTGSIVKDSRIREEMERQYQSRVVETEQ